MSRRDVLVAGGVWTLGAVLLGGCSAPRAQTTLPGPVWPGQGSTARGPAGPASPAPTPVPAPRPGPMPQPVTPGVLARSMWTRAGVARPGDINPMGRVLRITIHHDGMNPFTSTSMGDCAARLEAIRRAHVSNAPMGRGWADIGYHFIIDPAGRIWEGRSVLYQGAHVKDQNENNLGIMCLGNYDRQAPTPATAAALDRFVAEQMRRYGIPLSRVRTHQELSSTECPGRSLQAYIVRSRGPGGALAMACGELNDLRLA
jgi:hypothetical protein